MIEVPTLTPGMTKVSIFQDGRILDWYDRVDVVDYEGQRGAGVVVDIDPSRCLATVTYGPEVS